MKSRITLSRRELMTWAARYDEKVRGKKDAVVEAELRREVSAPKRLTRKQFLKICMWKSPRPRRFYKLNTQSEIRDATERSFGSSDERSRIEVLCELHGVKRRVGSAILHFAFPRRYGIWDFRAAWSLGLDNTDFDSTADWLDYSRRLREISKRTGLDFRTIDKALWEYSAENQ